MHHEKREVKTSFTTMLETGEKIRIISSIVLKKHAIEREKHLTISVGTRKRITITNAYGTKINF